MALFESYERRIDQINAELAKHGIASLEEAKQILDEKMQYCMDNRITDWNKIKAEVKEALGDFVWKETKRRPMIMPIIMEV